MQAKETKLQDIIEGTKQYMVPLFQRPYSWGKREWDGLWDDLVDLAETEKPRSHFIGSIVNMPMISVPEGVTKYSLIDGQQRITTILILLILLRDKARDQGALNFASEVTNTLIVNPYKNGSDHYKLWPTQVDRKAFENLVKGELNGNDAIIEAYRHFDRKYRRQNPNLEQLKNVITNYLSVVSIVLDPDDNPHLVFESLNWKGRPLTQADLIKNYVFMRIHADKQEAIYEKYWGPMQDELGDDIVEFVRHFLTRKGTVVKTNEIYQTLKEEVTVDNAKEYLEKLARYASYYAKLLNPEKESSETVRYGLNRLARTEATTVYPLLLLLYSDYDTNRLTEDDFTAILKMLENYLIRRFICSVPTNQLNKIFPGVCTQIRSNYNNQQLQGVRNLLQTKGYPKDYEIKSRLRETRLYGAGDRQRKTKLILESIEESFGHKERVGSDDLTIEHIMPQTLSPEWKDRLGEDWELTHELHLHNIGNLTLTAYNPELSNDIFSNKKIRLADSHLDLNRYFRDLEHWGQEEIVARSEALADIVLKVWPYFGDAAVEEAVLDVAGKKPTKLSILGQPCEVKTWRDVMVCTLEAIADLEPDRFQELVNEHPKFIGKESDKFRSSRELRNGYHIEVNLGANSIRSFCFNAVEACGLTAEDWKVEVE